MNFESYDFRNMASDEVYRYVKERVVPGIHAERGCPQVEACPAAEDPGQL